MPNKLTPEEMFKKEEKIEIDPCLDFSILMLEEAAELESLGKIYNRIQSPECKKIIEGFIYNGIIDILASIKGFEEECGIHSEFYKALLEETIEEFGDLNYVHTASNASSLIEVFHRNIFILCKKDNQIQKDEVQKKT